MSENPDAVVHHSVRGTHWHSAEDLVSAIGDRQPDLDVAVARTPAESMALAPTTEILLSSYADARFLDRAESLQWVQALSAGVDMLDVDRLEEMGVLLTSAAGAHAQPAAEQVLGYMLAFEREFTRARDMHDRGVWERFTGGELAGQTLGIVGLGEIGQRVAELADAVGMRTVATRRDPSADHPAVDQVHGPDDLSSILVEADYLLLACPLTEETRGLIGREEIHALKDDAVLINIARGPVVDEAALIEALQQRVIRGAALDVFATEPLPEDSTLWDLSNVLLTPHNAGSSPQLVERIADVFADNYDAYRGGAVDQLDNRIL